MSEKRIGIIMHGVTGRMGANQHLVRSILEIRKQGGVALRDGTRLMPDPILVGRNAAKLGELAKQHGVRRCTTDLDAALRSKDDAVFFDAASTRLRPRMLKQAIAAGKHVYCEKPVATNLAEALSLYRAAKKARVKHGVVRGTTASRTAAASSSTCCATGATCSTISSAG
jgi:predicted dehydrogenase